jgi:phosphatidylglycerol:prolipoprotein diacylglycerol transferase
MIITLPELNPVAFSIYFLDIRWYSLAYIFGILFGLFWLKKCNQERNILSQEAYENWITWIVFSILIGGRFGYILFYNFKYFINHPLEIFYFWHGGMSFHGGLIGVIFGSWLFCKKYKIHFFSFTDILAVATPVGLFFGRIANFINMELYGRVTEGNFGVIFPNAGDLPRHPSQIYEAMSEGILLFLILIILDRKTNFSKQEGKLSGVFLAGYGIFRIIVENFRQPDEQIGFLFKKITAGQFFSLPLIFSGMFLIFLPSFKKIKKSLHRN